MQSSALAAHPGGLNASGCHTEKRTGSYHCHGTGKALQPFGSQNTNTPGKIRSGGGSYRNCTAAREAGAAPVKRGDPGYGAHLDRDGDGIGCE